MGAAQEDADILGTMDEKSTFGLGRYKETEGEAFTCSDTDSSQLSPFSMTQGISQPHFPLLIHNSTSGIDYSFRERGCSLTTRWIHLMDSPYSSIYAASTTPPSSPSSLSSDHSAISMSTDDSSPSDKEFDKDHEFPPFSLSALAAVEQDNETYRLTNPLAAAAGRDAWAVVSSGEGKDVKASLRTFIGVMCKKDQRFASRPDDTSANALLEVALKDKDVRRMIVERYAEEKIKVEIEGMSSSPVDFEPLNREVGDIFAQATDTSASAQTVAKTLCEKIEIASALAPRLAVYRTRKDALDALTTLGEKVLASPDTFKTAMMAEKGVGIKLGLAMSKVVKEMSGREKGYVKREGLAKRVIGLVGKWEAEGEMGITGWVKALE